MKNYVHKSDQNAALPKSLPIRKKRSFLSKIANKFNFAILGGIATLSMTSTALAGEYRLPDPSLQNYSHAAIDLYTQTSYDNCTLGKKYAPEQEASDVVSSVINQVRKTRTGQDLLNRLDLTRTASCISLDLDSNTISAFGTSGMSLIPYKYEGLQIALNGSMMDKGDAVEIGYISEVTQAIIFKEALENDVHAQHFFIYNPDDGLKFHLMKQATAKAMGVFYAWENKRYGSYWEELKIRPDTAKIIANIEYAEQNGGVSEYDIKIIAYNAYFDTTYNVDKDTNSYIKIYSNYIQNGGLVQQTSLDGDTLSFLENFIPADSYNGNTRLTFDDIKPIKNMTYLSTHKSIDRLNQTYKNAPRFGYDITSDKATTPSGKNTGSPLHKTNVETWQGTDFNLYVQNSYERCLYYKTDGFTKAASVADKKYTKDIQIFLENILATETGKHIFGNFASSDTPICADIMEDNLVGAFVPSYYKDSPAYISSQYIAMNAAFFERRSTVSEASLVQEIVHAQLQREATKYGVYFLNTNLYSIEDAVKINLINEAFAHSWQMRYAWEQKNTRPELFNSMADNINLSITVKYLEQKEREQGFLSLDEVQQLSFQTLLQSSEFVDTYAVGVINPYMMDVNYTSQTPRLSLQNKNWEWLDNVGGDNNANLSAFVQSFVAQPLNMQTTEPTTREAYYRIVDNSYRPTIRMASMTP